MKYSAKIACLILMGMLLFTGIPLEAFASQEDGIGGIAFVNYETLRLREEPNTGSKELCKALRGEVVILLEKAAGGWYKVRYNLQEGYMLSGYLRIMTKENVELGHGYVLPGEAALSEKPEEGSKQLCTLFQKQECYTIGVNNGWYKVIANDTIGYIHSSLLKLTEIPYENRASVKKPMFFVLGQSTGIPPSAKVLKGEKPLKESGEPVTGGDILSEAEKYLGVRYVRGGESPKGFDCSGLIYYVLRELGYTPPRSVAAQYRMGAAVDADEPLRPGDLVFFATLGGKNATHVGIYAGEGQFLHAPNSRSKVSYGDLQTGYWMQHYLGARRLAE